MQHVPLQIILCSDDHRLWSEAVCKRSYPCIDVRSLGGSDVDADGSGNFHLMVGPCILVPLRQSSFEASVHDGCGLLWEPDPSRHLDLTEVSLLQGR